MYKRLTYKKVFIDSNYRLPQSRSSSDFVVELNENMECPQGTRLYVSEVSIPAVWKTTEVGFYKELYFMLYDNSDVLQRNSIVDLSNKIYFAEQLSFDMVQGMNDAVRDLNAGNDIFVYAYSSATRTVGIKVADGLNFKIKIPTDDELANYVNNTWDTGTANYNNLNPLSINYLLSNCVPTSPIATWTSSYLNLVPFRAIYINCPELTDHHYSAPNSFSSSIIKKVLIDQQLGGVISDFHTGLNEDYIDLSGKNLKRLSFRITDERSNTMNLFNIPIQFSLIFAHPSY